MMRTLVVKSREGSRGVTLLTSKSDSLRAKKQRVGVPQTRCTLENVANAKRAMFSRKKESGIKGKTQFY